MEIHIFTLLYLYLLNETLLIVHNFHLDSFNYVVVAVPSLVRHSVHWSIETCLNCQSFNIVEIKMGTRARTRRNE